MTIEQEMLGKLLANGFYHTDAAFVMDDVKSNPANAIMADRWNDKTEGYPLTVINVSWAVVRGAALKWIIANKPKAWFRPVFESESK